MNKTKIVLISVASTLLTLFILNHLILLSVLLFIVGWFTAGYWGASILKRDMGFSTGFEPIDAIPATIGYMFLLGAIFSGFKIFIEDIKWFFSKILGGRQIKFQSPVVITQSEIK